MQKNRNLLYVAASSLPFHISGYTSRTHEILKALYHEGYNFSVITRPGYPWDRRDSLAKPIDNSLELDGIFYNYCKNPGGRKIAAHYALTASRKIRDFAIKNNINCIHAASNHINALPALLAAKSMGLRFQYEIRGLWELTRAARIPAYADSPAFLMGLELEEFVSSHADTVFVISRQLGLYVAKRWNISEEKIKLLPNCADVNIIKPDKDIKQIPDLVGYAGSLISYEGLDTLIKAISILHSQNRKIKLMIIGDGEARPELETLVKDLNIQDYVNFIGRMNPEMARKELCKASLICLPRKDFEVCRMITPLKLVEAMALGKAVLCSDLPVFKDELGVLSQGWTFKAGDSKNLAEKLAEKFDRKEELISQGKKLREHVILSRQWNQHIPVIME